MPQNMTTLTFQNLIQQGAHRGNSRRIRVLTLSTTLRLAGTLLTLRVELFRIIFSARLDHGRILSLRPDDVYADLCTEYIKSLTPLLYRGIWQNFYCGKPKKTHKKLAINKSYLGKIV